MRDMPDRHTTSTPEVADSEGSYRAGKTGRAAIVDFPQRLTRAIGQGSIRGLGRRSGLSESVLRSYLRGATYPTLDRLAALAEASDTDLGWLATGHGHPDGGHSLSAIRVEQACMKVLAFLRRRELDPAPETVARLVITLAAEPWKESGLNAEAILELIAGSTDPDDPTR